MTLLDPLPFHYDLFLPFAHCESADHPPVYPVSHFLLLQETQELLSVEMILKTTHYLIEGGLPLELVNPDVPDGEKFDIILIDQAPYQLFLLDLIGSGNEGQYLEMIGVGYVY